jgi:hypothetical protein
MSNGFIYVVDAHFIDKIEKETKSWTQVPVVSSTNKTDRHELTEILLKVVLNTIKQTNLQTLGSSISAKGSMSKYSNI